MFVFLSASTAWPWKRQAMKKMIAGGTYGGGSLLQKMLIIEWMTRHKGCVVKMSHRYCQIDKVDSWLDLPGLSFISFYCWLHFIYLLLKWNIWSNYKKIWEKKYYKNKWKETKESENIPISTMMSLVSQVSCPTEQGGDVVFDIHPQVICYINPPNTHWTLEKENI